MKVEDLTIWIDASVRKFILAAGVGIPARFTQQGDDGEAKVQDQVEFQVAITHNRTGSRGEIDVLVNVQAVVKTKVVPSDVYYHTRVKARVADVLDRVIPVLKIGDTKYDKSQYGFLRRVPSETLTITPTSVEVSDASVIEAFYNLQEC